MNTGPDINISLKYGDQNPIKNFSIGPVLVSTALR